MTKSIASPLPEVPPPPDSLVSLNPFRWLAIFGPGAIIASLTIGTGELIFSSRGGSLFGYRILFLFGVISIAKWILVFSTARHMVLTGVHPLRRWLDLPWGPRGWLPAVMLVFAAICIPIWVSFHSSVVGDLLASLTGTKGYLNGATVHLWGILVLLAVTVVAFSGGYDALEKVQLLIVVVMLLVVGGALLLLQPDWIEMLWGAIWPQTLAYPEWLLKDTRPEMVKIASRPVWVEASLYVGVIGGASYDYLAYTSFLRNKQWGLAGSVSLPMPNEKDWPQLRKWIRAPLIDCTLSFIIVMIVSAVFVASGWLVLGPQHQVPGDGSFLDHQAQFVTHVHPRLFSMYVAGTFCAMAGTLYGTLEIAPAVLRETFRLLRAYDGSREQGIRLRRLALFWVTIGAIAVLTASFVFQCLLGKDRPPGLTQVLIPANLFTGVLSCGIICCLNPWMDQVLPKSWRSGFVLTSLNVVAGGAFLFLGVKGYWDFGGVWALGILVGTVTVGVVVAVALRSRIRET